MATAMAMASTGAWGRIAQGRAGVFPIRADASGVNDSLTGKSNRSEDAFVDTVKTNATVRKAPGVYVPTAWKRDTRTPHSGYHYDGTSRRFFEGWYFKVSIPEEKQSFAWMYSVEDPGAGKGSALPFDLFSGGVFPGVGAQIMGADDKYLCQFNENVTSFWGSKHELALGHTFVTKGSVSPPAGEVNPKEFLNRVEEGFQVTPTWHQGCLRDSGRSNYVETVPTARWEYSTRPIFGWGDCGAVQKATAGWLAALPVFEPHWQICMAGGLSTGWIEWGGKRYEFEDAPSYSEKNWGGSFPLKWFWMQCNVFDGVEGEVALTAGGGRRGLPFSPGTAEEVAMVGIHYAGKFYEFVPWEGNVEWEVSPWGSWKMQAHREEYEVSLEATADMPGCTLRAPTSDAGLAPFCRDTFAGKLQLRLWERAASGVRGKLILDATSDMCALEVGGGPWYSGWKTKARVQEPLRSLLRYSVDVESVFSPVPQLKPPGL